MVKNSNFDQCDRWYQDIGCEDTFPLIKSGDVTQSQNQIPSCTVSQDRNRPMGMGKRCKLKAWRVNLYKCTIKWMTWSRNSTESANGEKYKTLIRHLAVKSDKKTSNLIKLAYRLDSVWVLTLSYVWVRNSQAGSIFQGMKHCKWIQLPPWYFSFPWMIMAFTVW